MKKMQKAVLTWLTLVLLAASGMAAPVDVQVRGGDEGLTWVASLNLADNFDGARVARAEGFWKTTAAVAYEAVVAPLRTAADHAVWMWEHPVKAGAEVGVGAWMAGWWNPDELLRGEDPFSDSANKDDPSPVPGVDVQAKVTGDNNKFRYEYKQGAPSVAWDVNGSGNEFVVYPDEESQE